MTANLGSKNVTIPAFFSNLPVSRRNDSSDEGFDSPNLADNNLVLLIVASQVGQDPRCAGHYVHVVGAEKLHQALHQILHVILKESQNKYCHTKYFFKTEIFFLRFWCPRLRDS